MLQLYSDRKTRGEWFEVALSKSSIRTVRRDMNLVCIDIDGRHPRWNVANKARIADWSTANLAWLRKVAA
jgi:hypothetical protein